MNGPRAMRERGDSGPPIYYLSPHPDDVAFSCGGSVAVDAARGRRVTLVTVFTGGKDRAARQVEDRAAAAALCCGHAELGLPDAPERPEVHGRLDLFLPLRPRHLGMISEVVARLDRLIEKGAELVAPLGVGGHIDHRIVQAAARALMEHRQGTLSFYEDQPYSLAPYALGRRMAALQARISGLAEGQGPLHRAPRVKEIRAHREFLAGQPMSQQMGFPGLRWLMLRLAARAAVDADRPGHQPGFAPALRPAMRDVTEGQQARREAVAAYASQWPLFFPSLEAAHQVLESYFRALAPHEAGADRFYERLWRDGGPSGLPGP